MEARCRWEQRCRLSHKPLGRKQHPDGTLGGDRLCWMPLEADDKTRPKPYTCIGFGDIHCTKPYKYKRFGDFHGPKAYKSIGFGLSGHFGDSWKS